MAEQSTTKIQQAQNAVEEVIEIMRDNIDKTIHRGEKLETLQTQTEELAAHSMIFQRSAKSLSRAMWWKKCKLNLMIGGVCFIILTVIILIIVLSSQK